jgi:PAS domain S-box-containing protein
VRDAVLVLIATLVTILNVRLRKTQLSLARSEAAYRTTLTSIGDAVIATDPDGLVTFMNPVAEELTGWTEDEVRNRRLASFFRISNEETGAPVENPVDKVRRLGTIVGMANHTNLERRNGTFVPIDDSGAPIRRADGEHDGIVLVFRDVTERREAERQREILLARMQAAESGLREAVELYKDQVKALALAQQAGKSASWVRDVEHQQVRFLPGGFEIFGLPFADFGDRRPISFVEADDRAAIEAAFRKTIETGEPFQVEFRVRWPSGEVHCQEARGVRDAENPNLIRGTTFDITERKQAEMSLLRIEKLAAVGRIASTIAHEINNPLASVTNLLYLALLDPSISEEVKGYLERAEEELSRLRNVTRLTLSYARPHNQAKDIHPGEVIDSVLSLFRMRLEAKDIRIVRVCPEPFAIHIYLDEFQRILTNLIANAIDAVGPLGGVIRIAMERQESEGIIAIEDNGIGIPPERMVRVFDPFFTTKEEVGTGIGLWVTKELVEKNGGLISLSSGSLENGMRTRLEMRFPLSPAIP